jgi:hypothetical protein
MIKGLKELEGKALTYNIPFKIKIGLAEEKMEEVIKEDGIVGVVSDFSPLKLAVEWRKGVSNLLKNLKIPYHMVDAHNVFNIFYFIVKKFSHIF